MASNVIIPDGIKVCVDVAIRFYDDKWATEPYITATQECLNKFIRVEPWELIKPAAHHLSEFLEPDRYFNKSCYTYNDKHNNRWEINCSWSIPWSQEVHNKKSIETIIKLGMSNHIRKWLTLNAKAAIQCTLTYIHTHLLNFEPQLTTEPDSEPPNPNAETSPIKLSYRYMDFDHLLDQPEPEPEAQDEVLPETDKFARKWAINRRHNRLPPEVWTTIKESFQRLTDPPRYVRGPDGKHTDTEINQILQEHWTPSTPEPPLGMNPFTFTCHIDIWSTDAIDEATANLGTPDITQWFTTSVPLGFNTNRWGLQELMHYVTQRLEPDTTHIAPHLREVPDNKIDTILEVIKKYKTIYTTTTIDVVDNTMRLAKQQ